MAGAALSSFEQFYPYYVGQHSKAATRWIHLAGTLTGAAAAAGLVASGRPRGLAAWPLISYGAAWTSHYLVERNRPATFGHPLWSLHGDFRMIATMLGGRDHELAQLAATHRTSDPRAPLAQQVVAG
ncbi:MAG: Mpo1-like protein [Frankiaceae bacterium]